MVDKAVDNVDNSMWISGATSGCRGLCKIAVFSDPALYKVVADAYAFPEEVVGPQIPYIRSR